MDLEEWEYLPDDGFLDFGEDGARKGFIKDYFICPSPPPKRRINFIQPHPPPPPPPSPPPSRVVVSKQLVHHLPILDADAGAEAATISTIDDEVVKHITKVSSMKEADQDPVSQVFFKKMKENEFVDMKMDSPKSGSRGILPQIESSGFQFDDKDEMKTVMENSKLNTNQSKKSNLELELNSESKEREGNWEERSGGGFNMWKWSLTGIGALCSFGVAATTICIIIFASSQRSRHHQQNNQKLRFQIYADDKRIKQVVHHATKLNEAISTVRGVPLTRAHITFGGYYDGL